MSEKNFDKYYYYSEAVQSPETDALFFQETYEEIRAKKPQSLCEDFCGTFKISCEWTKLGESNTAVGLDLDEEPIEYGRKKYLPELNENESKRIQIKKQNVLTPIKEKFDVVAAMNFSFYIFKERSTLLEYFRSSYNKLKDDGVFIIDAFGGPACMQPNEEITEHEDYNYHWDQDQYDFVSNFTKFYIHFSFKDGRRYDKAFTYDWRMWSLPEIKELLLEAGYKDVQIFWEEDDSDGVGTGCYSQITVGEEVESWVVYMAAIK